MTVSRLPLIVPLLLLAAAAPETAPTETVPSAPPPAVTAPNAPPAATVPSAPPAATAPSVPPAATAPSAPSAATVPNPPSAATAPSVPPAVAASKPPPAAKGPKLPPTVSLQKVAPEAAMPILGDTVVGPGGKVIARLVDVLVDAAGQPVAAVLDFGGFMGVGTRKIAVHWNALHFEPAATEHRVILLLTSNEIKAAPEYKGESKVAPVVVPAATAAQPGPQ